MNKLSSTEFRKRFARLTEETAVTVHGHRIGVWMPHAAAYTTVRDLKTRIATDAASVQSQRDQLLNRINRS